MQLDFVSRLKQFAAHCLIALAVTAVCGCSQSEPKAATYPVSGVVTKGGNPIEGATVVFVPNGSGQAAFGTTDKTGKYQLTTFVQNDGAVPGTYRIKVSKVDSTATQSGKVYANSEEEQQDYNPDAKPSAPSKSVLPPTLADESTSQLTHTVTTSASTFDIQIK